MTKTDYFYALTLYTAIGPKAKLGYWQPIIYLLITNSPKVRAKTIHQVNKQNHYRIEVALLTWTSKVNYDDTINHIQHIIKRLTNIEVDPKLIDQTIQRLNYDAKKMDKGKKEFYSYQKIDLPLT